MKGWAMIINEPEPLRCSKCATLLGLDSVIGGIERVEVFVCPTCGETKFIGIFRTYPPLEILPAEGGTE